MKPSIIWIVAALCLVVTVIYVASTQRTAIPSANVADRTEAKTAITQTNDIHDAEQIPLYPNSQNVTEKQNPLQKLFPIVSFDTHDSQSQVIGYYESVLPKKGWQRIEDFSSLDFRRIEFRWIDSSGLLPWQSNVKIRLDSSTRDANGTITSVDLNLTRVPIATKVPVPPESSRVETTDGLDKYGTRNRHVTYMTSMSPSAIETYYKTKLTEYGWAAGWGSDIGQGTIQSGLVFSYDIGGPEAVAWGRLTIIAKVVTETETQVEVLIEGTDVSQQ